MDGYRKEGLGLLVTDRARHLVCMHTPKYDAIILADIINNNRNTISLELLEHLIPIFRNGVFSTFQQSFEAMQKIIDCISRNSILRCKKPKPN